MKSNTILGLSGVAGSGKDMFCEILLEKAPDFKKFSLAHKLKEEIREDLLKEYNIDIFNCSREQKDKVRPRLVEWGSTKRGETDGRHWINQLEPSILGSQDFPICITDIRYDDYELDEAFWLQKQLGGVLVHVSRYKIINNNKKFIEAPNEEERRNDPKLRSKADYSLQWPTFESNVKECAGAHVDSFLSWLNGYNEAFKKDKIRITER